MICRLSEDTILKDALHDSRSINMDYIASYIEKIYFQSIRDKLIHV